MTLIFSGAGSPVDVATDSEGAEAGSSDEPEHADRAATATAAHAKATRPGTSVEPKRRSPRTGLTPRLGKLDELSKRPPNACAAEGHPVVSKNDATKGRTMSTISSCSSGGNPSNVVSGPPAIMCSSNRDRSSAESPATALSMLFCARPL